MKKGFVAAPVVLSADVADSGTFTVNYPDGYNVGDFENARGHYLSLNGSNLVQPEDITLSFGTSSVTVTNGTGGTLPEGAKGYFQFELPGNPVAVQAKSDRIKVQNVHATGVLELLIDLGAPATLDADGIWDGVSVGATADQFTVADMKTATANGGVLDVERNVTVTGSSGADQVVTINGFDRYDNAVSETITASSTSTVAGKKGFKRVVTMDVAAGGSASKTLDVGWGDVLGLPVAIDSQYQIIREIKDGAYLKKLNEIELLPFAALEAEVDGATSIWVPTGFAGSVLSMTTAVGDAITTGGAITLEIGGTPVDGLSVTVADSSAAGDIDTDTATEGHATADFTATQALEVVFASAFNASGRIRGTIEVKRSSLVNGTLVTALAKNTKSTATTADVRGTYTPPVACNGAISFGLLVRVQDLSLGNLQYAA